MRRITRNLLLVLIVSVMLVTLAVSSFSSNVAISFSDVPKSHWGYSAITEMTKRGLFSGTTEPINGVGTFDPDAPMTRAAFITVITRELYPDGVKNATGGSKWWSPYYNVALENGLLTESELDNGNLDKSMTREEMSMILVRSAEKKGEKTNNLVSESQIADYSTVGNYYKSYVKECFSLGLIGGTDSKGTFSPKGTLNRAAAATVIYRLINASQRLDVDIQQASTFAVHFIDVGQADATLVLCDGKAMLIDGGNVGDSSKIYTYLKKHEITHLDFVVGTHAHEDHIGGLAGALNYATVDKVYCPVTLYDSDAFRDFVKYVGNRNSKIIVPKVGDSFNLGSAKVEVLAVNTSSDTNNSSIVLKIEYGETTFLFTGDAEREVEEYLLEREANLSSTVLKVGHHGSETSTSYVFLREIMPEYAVISVGEGNSYGHPTDDVLSRLRDADVKVFRTDLQGDIICMSDGKKVTFNVEKNPDADTLKSPELTGVTKDENTVVTNDKHTDYILNTNTKKFHYPDCKSVKQMTEKNKKAYSGSREELISTGYSPCGNCDS